MTDSRPRWRPRRLNGAANLHPTCTPADHDPRALNVCLLVKQTPVVLGFFVTGSSGCEREVTALQTVSHEFPAGEVQFAAVAVRASHAAVAAAVRAHHWTIPVAYDEDGRGRRRYGVEVCPIVELAYRGGVVARRLIGEHWNSSTALASQVRALPGRGEHGRMSEELELAAAPGFVESRLKAEFPGPCGSPG